MQLDRMPEPEARRAGRGLRAVLLGRDGPAAAETAQRLSGLGCGVERFDETFAALGAVLDDPAGCALFVMLCDGLGEMEAGLRAYRLLSTARERLPVILCGSDCPAPDLPGSRDAPARLGTPLSAATLRLGFEHALRDRLAWAAA